jgi:hypothetical protein
MFSLFWIKPKGIKKNRYPRIATFPKFQTLEKLKLVGVSRADSYGSPSPLKRPVLSLVEVGVPAGRGLLRLSKAWIIGGVYVQVSS